MRAASLQAAAAGLATNTHPDSIPSYPTTHLGQTGTSAAVGFPGIIEQLWGTHDAPIILEATQGAGTVTLEYITAISKVRHLHLIGLTIRGRLLCISCTNLLLRNLNVNGTGDGHAVKLMQCQGERRYAAVPCRLPIAARGSWMVVHVHWERGACCSHLRTSESHMFGLQRPTMATLRQRMVALSNALRARYMHACIAFQANACSRDPLLRWHSVDCASILPPHSMATFWAGNSTTATMVWSSQADRRTSSSLVWRSTRAIV